MSNAEVMAISFHDALYLTGCGGLWGCFQPVLQTAAAS